MKVDTPVGNKRFNIPVPLVTIILETEVAVPAILDALLFITKSKFPKRTKLLVSVKEFAPPLNVTVADKLKSLLSNNTLVAAVNPVPVTVLPEPY